MEKENDLAFQGIKRISTWEYRFPDLSSLWREGEVHVSVIVIALILMSRFGVYLNATFNTQTGPSAHPILAPSISSQIQTIPQALAGSMETTRTA